jgi:hypothetical protein
MSLSRQKDIAVRAEAGLRPDAPAGENPGFGSRGVSST